MRVLTKVRRYHYRTIFVDIDERVQVQVLNHIFQPLRRVPYFPTLPNPDNRRSHSIFFDPKIVQCHIYILTDMNNAYVQEVTNILAGRF